MTVHYEVDHPGRRREYLHGMSTLHTGETFEGIRKLSAGERRYAQVDTGGRLRS
jgi:hypothetical protein